MDKTDEKILDLLKGNSRMSFQELGDALGMSRVAARKRVVKLEEAGIIRGYNTTIYRDGEVTMFMDIVTREDHFDEILEYLGTRAEYALDFCYERLDPMINKGVCICAVPSSDPENIFSGIMLVAKRLAAAERVDLTFVLKRTKRVEKLSLGGYCGLGIHLNSITVTHPKMVAGRRILILDDVTTTGNSLQACKRLLLAAGAAEVEMLALARTVRRMKAGYK